MARYLTALLLSVCFLLPSPVWTEQLCYYAPGRLAGSSIIPCTNPAKGITWCCQQGDICLADQSCWNAKYVETYQYGCTDPTYSDTNHCPQKCGLDVEKSRWVGLMYCEEVGNLWACHHPDTCRNCTNPNVWAPAINDTYSQPGRGCEGLKTVVAAFAAASTIEPSVQLPEAPGGETTYFSRSGTKVTAVPGYTPAWVTAGDATSATTTGQPTAAGATDASSSTPTTTPTTTSVPAESAASSSNSTVGIAVGASLGGLAVISAAAAFFLRRRRLAKNKPEQEPLSGSGGDHTNNEVTEASASASAPTTAGWPSSPYSELHGAESKRPVSELPSTIAPSSNPSSPAPTYSTWMSSMSPPPQTVSPLPHTMATPPPPNAHMAELSQENAVVYELPGVYDENQR